MGPMGFNFVQPGIQTLPADGAESIQNPGHFLHFRTHPPHQLQHVIMLIIEILPMQDAFVMENTVSEGPNFPPLCI